MEKPFLVGLRNDEAEFSQLDDPWDLPPYFLLWKNKWQSPRTYSGYWKEKEEERTAIRSAGESSSSSSPSYVGVRKTLEFYLNDGCRGGEGTKTDWVCHDYYDLRKDDAGEALLLQEDVVIRKIFNKKYNNETDQASSLHRQVESCVKAYKEVSSCREKKIRGNATHRCDESIQLVLILGVVKNCLGADPCDPDGKSDNVWQHFTKICSENDPDEVYAVCHRCDTLLKAHPEKDGTFHLTNHIHTCSSSSKSNPSTDEDREMLRRLRTVLDNPYELQRSGEKLDCQEDLTQLDPGDLKRIHPTPWYVTRSLNRQTHGGHWKEINKELTAIRMEDQLQMQGGWKDIHKEISVVQMDHQFQVQVPQYMGVRRTLQFEPQDGTEMYCIMLEYQQLIPDMESPALFLQGDMVIRKVLQYDKEAVTSAFIELNRWLKSDDDTEEYCYKGEGVNMDSTLSSDYVHVEGTRKRKRNVVSKRTSKVWVHLTEIRTADHDVVYAVCHRCDRGYGSARSTNGTTHLWRHTKSCSGKLPGTGNANDATGEWEAVISPLLLLLKNYGETQH